MFVYCEPCDVSEYRTVKARKPHKCIECGHPIAKGESHEVFSGLFDGRWFHDRTCECCAKARCSVLNMLELPYGECIPSGELWDIVREFYPEMLKSLPTVKVTSA